MSLIELKLGPKRVYLLSIIFGFTINSELLKAQSRPSFSAYKIYGTISVDGNLNENVWNKADAASGFRQFEPDEGAPASQKTKVQVVYGDNNIYIGATLLDQHPAAIQQKLGPRDDYNQADWFRVAIDSYFNKRNATVFGVNAGGVQWDGKRTGESIDNSWDGLWESATKITAEGWSLEMRIPYSMLRFSKAEEQTWGVHFTRKIPRLGEQSEWPLIPRSERSNLVAEFGHIRNITNVNPKPNLQIRPYTNVRLKTKESTIVDDKSDATSSINVGGNITYGMGPNITLDATINPDFGQVDSDPAVLNLSAFETAFSEKRPFFLEGSQNYQFNITVGELFYSRRIGAQKPIIGAAKLTGRSEGDLSFGILGATTGDEFNPSNSYGVVRFTQQIGSFSSVGGILTGYDGSSAYKPGRGRSITGGGDWDLRFSNNKYGVEGFVTFARNSWGQSLRTSKTGFMGKLQFIKREGLWNGYSNFKVLSDKFDPNAVGQLDRNNFMELYNRLNREINQGDPFGPFQRVDATVSWGKRISYDQHLNLLNHITLSSNWLFRNLQQIEVGGDFQLTGGYDLYETRGLGPWAQPSSVEINGEFNTDNRRQWMLSPEGSYTFYDDGGSNYNIALSASWDIGDNFSFTGNLKGTWEENVTAWVSNESFKHTNSDWAIGNKSVSPDELTANDFIPFNNKGALNTILDSVEPYGTTQNQYFIPVFGRRDTRALGLTIRPEISFTPKLSLQMYSQFFMARGRYNKFKILQNRDKLAPFDTYPKQSSFTLNSYQSNIILSWEYRPGSTVYLIWTHSRRERTELNPLASSSPFSPYQKPIGQRIRDTFQIFPQNVFMIKLDYTFLY